MRKIHFLLFMVTTIFLFCSTVDSNQEILKFISDFKKVGVGYSVHVEDGYVYITNNSGMVIVDVHRPERPRMVGDVPAGVTFGVDVEKNRAYLSGDQVLVIADVSNPEDPKKQMVYPMRKKIHDVKAAGHYLYVAGEDGLDILDIGVPGKITPAAHIACNPVREVAVYHTIAYLASPNSGINVIDITDPESPRKMTTIAGTEGAWDLHVYGDFLYAGCHGRGVKILDISDRKSPRIIGSFCDDDGGEAQGVWGDGECLYIADNYHVEVLDVRDPANPREIGEYDKVAGAHDIFVDGDYIYVAEAKKGLIIFELKKEKPIGTPE